MSFLDVYELAKKHSQLLLIIPAIFLVVAFLLSLIRPKVYTAETSMYVLSDTSVEEGGAVSSGDLSFGQMLTNDISALLTSPRVKEDVAEQLGLSSLAAYTLEVNQSDYSRLITLRVSGNDPEMTARVANAIVADTDSLARELMGVEAVNAISQARTPESPSNSTTLQTLATSLVAGFVAALVVIIAIDLIDVRLKSDAEAEDYIGVPVIGHFPRVERV